MRALGHRVLVSAAALSWLVASVCAGAAPAAAQADAAGKQSDAADAASPALPGALADDIFETVARVPVSLNLPDGSPYKGDMVVTHFRPAGTGPFPIVVLSHGRTGATRHDPARVRTVPLARFWTRRGFAVVVPTRVGYGALGQHVDPEASGACSRADYRPAIAAMAAQVEAAVAFAAKLPWADNQRIVLSGVSYGGFGTIGAAARPIPGLIGAINFAGGLGGSPQARPADPCRGDGIAAIAGEAGARARAPMLWLYAENDLFWGRDWPRRWHDAYVASGGQAKFVSFPAIGDDGHKLMSQGRTLWRPEVDRFLAEIGIEPPRASSRLPDSGFAALDDAGQLPYVKPQVKTEGYVKFLAADLPRAFAVSPTGAWAWRSGHDAVEVALSRCQTNSRSPCALYAVDDRVVWRPDRR